MSDKVITDFKPEAIRALIRANKWLKPTNGLAKGFMQANLVILQKNFAYDFLVFCHRNPKPCPLLYVSDVGLFTPHIISPSADIRTDLPKYLIYQQGKVVEEATDILKHWKDDLVFFLLGCSISFEHSLINNGIPIGNYNAPMYVTNIPCVKSGKFEGPLVVSMRPVPEEFLVRTIQVSSHFPAAHGVPVHIGNPEKIGIADMNKPDFGNPVSIDSDEVPVFWACGVTPQAIAMHIQLDFMITHAPGFMFITDIPSESLMV